MLKAIFYCLLSPIFSSKFSPSFLFMPYSTQLFGKSSLIFQYLEEEGEGEGREGLGACEMRKRQVVVRRSEEPSRNTATSSYTVRSVWYGECQKNHAANVGGYAVDGCREFMASGEEGTNAALTCAACGCHRNFHRREVETEVVCDCSSSPSSN